MPENCGATDPPISQRPLRVRRGSERRRSTAEDAEARGGVLGLVQETPLLKKRESPPEAGGILISTDTTLQRRVNARAGGKNNGDTLRLLPVAARRTVNLMARGRG